MPERYEWISVGEASRRLNVSPSTVRRMIEAGALVGERQVIGGSRERFLVRFDAPDMPQEASGEASDAPVAGETPDAPEARSEPPDAIMALLAELREMRRQENERRTADASQIAELRERVGRAEERAERLLAEKEQWALDVMEQTERAVRAEAELQRLRGRRWWDPRTW
jgi:excisionase family DNA binding protein